MKTKQACVPIDLCRENIFLKMLCSVCFSIRGRIFSFTRERAMLSNDVHYVGIVFGLANPTTVWPRYAHGLRQGIFGPLRNLTPLLGGGVLVPRLVGDLRSHAPAPSCWYALNNRGATGMTQDTTERLFDLGEEYETLLQKGIGLSGEDARHFVVGRVNDLKKQLPPAWLPQRILDFGCGIGTASRYLAEVFSGSSVIGVDLSGRTLDYAARLNGSERIRFAP